MKRIIFTVVALLLVVGLGTADAVEKKKNRKAPKKGKRTEKTEEMQEPRRKGDMHNLAFHSGMLNQEGYGTWRVGDLNLVLKKDCPIMSDMSDDGALREGSTALVMGSRMGDTIVAWSIRVMGPDVAADRTSDFETRIDPGDDPNVGVMANAPE